jgi:hypothetical protein
MALHPLFSLGPLPILPIPLQNLSRLQTSPPLYSPPTTCPSLSRFPPLSTLFIPAKPVSPHPTYRLAMAHNLLQYSLPASFLPHAPSRDDYLFEFGLVGSSVPSLLSSSGLDVPGLMTNPSANRRPLPPMRAAEDYPGELSLLPRMQHDELLLASPWDV